MNNWGKFINVYYMCHSGCRSNPNNCKCTEQRTLIRNAQNSRIKNRQLWKPLICHWMLLTVRISWDVINSVMWRILQTLIMSDIYSFHLSKERYSKCHTLRIILVAGGSCWPGHTSTSPRYDQTAEHCEWIANKQMFNNNNKLSEYKVNHFHMWELIVP